MINLLPVRIVEFEQGSLDTSRSPASTKQTRVFQDAVWSPQHACLQAGPSNKVFPAKASPTGGEGDCSFELPSKHAGKQSSTTLLSCRSSPWTEPVAAPPRSLHRQASTCSPPRSLRRETTEYTAVKQAEGDEHQHAACESKTKSLINCLYRQPTLTSEAWFPARR
jgi:hypothetical protein